MRKIIFTLAVVAFSLSAQAYDYPYLAFQTSDGSVTTVSVESLSITISDGQLVATNGDGSKSFTLSDLSKMYFSTESTAISSVETETNVEVSIYDLTGRKVSPQEMQRGVYILKTSIGTRKVTVK